MYDHENHIGSAKVDLGKLYKPNSQKEFQKSFEKKFDILSTDGIPIGDLGGLFVMTEEKWFKCKGNMCNQKEMEMSAVLKHLSHSKPCKSMYTEEEINDLRSLSKKRKKEMELKRQKRKYNVQKQQKKYKRNYSAEKRQKRYKEDLAKKKKMNNELNKERHEKDLKDYKKSVIEDARKNNLFGYDCSIDSYQCGLISFNSDQLLEAKRKFGEIKNMIGEKYQQFEKEIDKALDEAKDKEDDSEVAKIYGELVATSRDSPNRIHYEWHDMQMNTDILLKKIAEEMKVKYKWGSDCLCKKCKINKNLDEKEWKEARKKVGL